MFVFDVIAAFYLSNIPVDSENLCHFDLRPICPYFEKIYLSYFLSLCHMLARRCGHRNAKLLQDEAHDRRGAAAL